MPPARLKRLENPAFASGYAAPGLTCAGLRLLVPQLNLKPEPAAKTPVGWLRPASRKVNGKAPSGFSITQPDDAECGSIGEP